MRSLAAKLLLSFFAVVAVGIVAVAFLANRATDAEFASYVAVGNSQRVVRVAEALAGYYAATGGWQKIDPLIENLARSSQERLVVVDEQGTVVADTAERAVGRHAGDLGLSDPIPVIVAGREVGQVYAQSPASGGMGRGAGGFGGPGRGRQGLGPPAASNELAARSPEQSFLDGVSQSLWWAALVAGLLAVALGLLLTRQIVSPLRLLSLGANRVAAGDLSHRVAVRSHDEIGNLATSFNTMAASLERNELARRNLLADVAHELRTPLTVIEGTADAMLDGVYDLTADNVRLIREQAALLTKLIADLRDLSLAEAGQLVLALEPTDLSELAERVLRQHEAAARERGLRLVAEASRPLPPVSADPRRLAQVLGNLIANALRHTPSEGQITVRVHEAAPGWLRLSVADTGEGIAPEDLPHIFDRFYRADKSRSRRSGGSGLGLAIARQIVIAHGGRIWAESRPGFGSTFTFELPLPPSLPGKPSPP